MSDPSGFGPPVADDQSVAGFGAPVDDSGQKSTTPPAPSHPIMSGLDRFLAPSDMTGNDPNTLHGYAKTWGEALKGAASGIKSFVTTPFPGTKENPVIWNPITQAKKDIGGLEDWYQEYKENPNYAMGQMIGPMLLTHTVSRLMAPAGMAAKLTRGTGGMASDIEPTINDLRTAAKTINPETGKPIGPPKTVRDFVDHTSIAENNLNNEYANALGPYANRLGPITPDGTFPVADAIKNLKEKMGNTTAQDKAARAYVDKVASEFEHPMTLDELNRQRIAANARLYSFENKSDVAQYSAAGANAGTAVDKAIANTVRDVVYPEMDRLTGKPEGYFRNLQGRVGNLFRLQSAAKDYAEKVHQSTMAARGSTPLERVHPGAAVSAGGGVHGYLSNLPAMFRAPNPEAGADAAVRSAYGMRQRITPPPESMSLPVSALMGAIRSGELGPNHQLSQSKPK